MSTNKFSTYPLLSSIQSPADIRHLEMPELKKLAQEIRLFLLDSLDKTGGHLSSGLGVTELTIALHYVFKTPEDKLVWDVGHQSYPHKLLTGRLGQITSIRTKGGLSGFPRRDESPYDAFGVGHSSTSISAALGMAITASLKQNKQADKQHRQKNIAIIGDGAMTAGMAFEALNHAGDLDTDLLVILNDNDMSISKNVGGMSNYFAKLISGKFYSSMRENSKKVLGVMPPVWDLAKRTEEHLKGMIVPGTLFEELGFNYIGPIDGHDIETLITTLDNIKHLSGPQFLHVVTKKGYGYAHAEADPIKYHAVSPGFYGTTEGTTEKEKENKDPQKATTESQPSKQLSYTQVFSQWINNKAAEVEELIAITPAMKEGSGLVEFAQNFPQRYFDVGIAEQHAVTFAAGTACDGLRPVVAIYSSFLQRAYDQFIHDVAIQKLPVLFAIDRAGLVGSDGATHSGNFDLSFMRCIPNLVIMAPADENECYHMLDYGFELKQPAAVRYPRGKGSGQSIEKSLSSPLASGKARIINQPNKDTKKIQLAILNIGSLLHFCLPLIAKLEQQNIQLTLVDMRFVKPMDTQLVKKIALENQYIISLEDNAKMGGAGSAINEILSDFQPHPIIKNIALPDEFPEHATQEELYQQYQLDSDGLYNIILALVKARF
ncbi:MAG: 1-deoxy-D-xylulose-5-phosphate synthase [Pseudomonadota bacterium]